MLCTLVIAIGTFPYALLAVTIPWSPDQNTYFLSDLMGNRDSISNTVEARETGVRGEV